MFPLSRRLAAAWLLVLIPLIASLVGCGVGSTGTASVHATSTPTIDPALLTYATAVQKYYQPFSGDEMAEDGGCRQAQPTPWSTCQTLTATILTDGQAMLDQLKATPAPAQLQPVDTALKQAVQDALAEYMKRAAVVKAHSSAGFADANVALGTVLTEQCVPVKQFDAATPLNEHILAPNGVCVGF